MTKTLIGIAAALLAGAAQGQAQTYTISTVAGNGSSGFAGDGSSAAAAQLALPGGIAIDKSGNVFIADSVNSRIRKIATDGTISTVAGTGGAGYNGDGGAATAALLSSPGAVALDSSGNLYIADTGNDLIRKVTGTTITTVAGNITSAGFGSQAFGGDNGPATSALLNGPTGVAVDASGNLYIADTKNNRIRKVTGTTITTYAGDGNLGSAGDGGRAVIAHINAPRGLALDGAGNLYIADSGNHRVRVVAASNQVINTIAGTGTLGFSGDFGLATKAQLNVPHDVTVDAAGNVYIADYSNSRIRKVSTAGVISTIAGNGRFGVSGDGGPATSATLNFPAGLALDASGRIYIADAQSSTVRLLTPVAGTAVVPKVLTGGVIQPAEFGGGATVAPGSWVEIYGSGLARATATWSGLFSGVNAPTAINGTSVLIAGQQAFLSFVGDGQVNAQIPSGTPSGVQSLTVNTAGGASATVPVTVAATSPAFFQPSLFKVGGKQYAAAVFLDGATFAMPAGAVSGIVSRPAKPGETVTFYGVGFGAVTPDTPAGQIVQKTNALTAPVQVQFGNLGATVQYQGLAGSAIGLYQFNVVIPTSVAPGDVAVTFTQSGQTVAAGLITIGN
jgi:trimeric autotransporter adhesin